MSRHDKVRIKAHADLVMLHLIRHLNSLTDDTCRFCIFRRIQGEMAAIILAAEDPSERKREAIGMAKAAVRRVAEMEENGDIEVVSEGLETMH